MKKFNKYLYRIMAAVLLLLTALPLTAFAAETVDLGDVSHYNGIIFGDLTATQADTEGALAVQGYATFGSNWNGYDVGGAVTAAYPFMGTYTNPNKYPSLLLGSLPVSIGNGVRVRGGGIVMKESVRTAYQEGDFSFDISGGTIQYEDDSAVDAFFSSAFETVTANSGYLAGLESPPITVSEFKALKNQDLSKFEIKDLNTDDRYLVINIDGGNSITFGELSLPNLDAYDVIVFNFSASKVAITGGSIYYDGKMINTSAPIGSSGNEALAELAPKLVWNFPNAETITMQYFGLIGSVIAPYASFSGNGGSVNGQFYAESLLQQNGMELHAFRMGTTSIWDLAPEPDNAEETEAEIYKTDSEDDDIRLEGAAFSVFKWDGDEWNLIASNLKTDKNGELVITQLTEGRYRLVETLAPDGYQLNTENETLFTVETDREGNIRKPDAIFIKNQAIEIDDQTTTANFFKVDEDTDEPLEGAEFDFHEKIEEDWVLKEAALVTDPEGQIRIPDVAIGDYKIIETKAPDGYLLPDDNETEFSVVADENGDIIKPDVLVIPNKKLDEPEPETEIEIFKAAEDDQEHGLEGAVFSLYVREEDSWQLIESDLVTDEHGLLLISSLTSGHYRLVETKAPDGYQLDPENETLFTIQTDSDGDIIPPEALTIFNKAVVTVPPEKGSVKLIKQDSEDDTLFLEGAVFSLYTVEGEKRTLYAKDLKTDSGGVLQVGDLEAGSYLFVETQAPDGYQLKENIEIAFTLTADQNGSVLALEPLVVKNDKIPEAPDTDVELLKLDEDEDTPLENAVFILYHRVEDQWEVLETDLKTDGEGKILMKNLVPGDYRLIESSAPEGYELPLNNELLFTIKTGTDGKIITPEPIVVYNKAIKNPDEGVTATILKLDRDDPTIPLENAVFSLYQYDGNKWVLQEENLKTNSDGLFHIENLESGSYKLTETKAPDGYRLKTSGTLFSILVDENDNLIAVDTIEIYNSKDDNPGGPDPVNTGDSLFTWMLFLGGIMLLTVSIIVYTIKSGKQKYK